MDRVVLRNPHYGNHLRRVTRDQLSLVVALLRSRSRCLSGARQDSTALASRARGCSRHGSGARDIGVPARIPACARLLRLADRLPSWGRIRLYNRLGDYSYGVYIYAFPVQQLAAHSWSGITPFQDMALALPVTLLFALLSWHLLEKPALALRDRIAVMLVSQRGAGLSEGGR